MASSFSQYYNTHPEYRKKHLEKLKEKVECPICHIFTARANMTTHKKTTKHKYNEKLQQINDPDVKDLAIILSKLKTKYKNINEIDLNK